MARRGSSYTEKEVQALIEEYAALKAKADTTRRGLLILVMVADLELALRRLSRKYREVVVLHGLAGLSSAETAAQLQVSYQAVNKRYRQALEETHYLMNGGE